MQKRTFFKRLFVGLLLAIIVCMGVVMFDGEVFAEGTVDEIRKNEAVQKIYLGEAAAT